MKVTVIGAGTMGAGIAGQSALCGFETNLYDITVEALERGVKHVNATYDKGVSRAKITENDVVAARARLTVSADLREAIASADLVVEAIPEKMDLKQSLFERIEAWVQPNTILATNTSSLSISSMASVLTHPDRFVGLHFFNPVAVMKLLEIVRGQMTSETTIQRAIEFARHLRKDHILVNDVPGFATSRLGITLGNEAMRMLEQGVASAEDIDKAMVLGYRHPIGPLALSDLVGLDVRLAITQHLHREIGTDVFKPPKILIEKVERGELGRKTKHGFFHY